MAHRIELTATAQRSIRDLDKPVRERVLARIKQLAEDPAYGDRVALREGESEYRSRVGDWRILFDVDDANGVVLIVDVRHRSKAYR